MGNKYAITRFPGNTGLTAVNGSKVILGPPIRLKMGHQVRGPQFPGWAIQSISPASISSALLLR